MMISQILDQRPDSHLESLAEAAVQAVVHVELLHEACSTASRLSPCRQKGWADFTYSSAAMLSATAETDTTKLGTRRCILNPTLNPMP